MVVATADGVVSVEATGGVAAGLAGRRVRALAPASWRTLWAALDGGEIWRCRDGTWERVVALASDGGAEALEVRCLAGTRANDEGGILAGTTAVGSCARPMRDGGSWPGSTSTQACTGW